MRNRRSAISDTIKYKFFLSEEMLLTFPYFYELQSYNSELKIWAMKKRKPYKATTLKTLQKEVHSLCPFCSNGDVEQFEIHHIDENPENNDISNLLMLCPTCHSKITKGFIQVKEVVDRKQILSKGTRELSDKALNLLSNAWQSRNSGHYELAMSQLEEGKAEAKKDNDEFTEAHFNFHWAVIQNERYHQTDVAVDTMLQCLNVFRKYHEIGRFIDAYSALSEFETHRKNFIHARSYALKALELTQKLSLENPTHFLDLSEKYTRLGWVEHHLGNYDVALEKYDLGISRLLSEPNTENEKLETFRKQLLGGAYHYIGLTHARLGNRLDAKSAFNKASQYYREIHLTLDLAKSLQELSHILFLEAEYDEGEERLNEAIHLFFLLEDYSGCFRCIDLKIRLCYTKGEKEKAYQTARECCKMLEIHQVDRRLLGEFYSKIGNIHLGNEEYGAALDYYSKAKEICEKDNNVLGVAQITLSIGEAKKREGRLDEYKTIVNEAIAVLKQSLLKIEADEMKAFTFGTIAHCHALIEEYNEALLYITKAKVIFETKGVLPGMVKCLTETARIYSLLDQNDKSVEIMLSVKKMIDGSSYYDLIAQTNITLADYQIGFSNYPEAQSLLQEADFYNRKYNLDITSDIEELNDRLKYALSICGPIETSFQSLVTDLFNLIDWFPEAKDKIFRMWFYCHMEQIYACLRSLSGIKLMLFEDDVDKFIDRVTSLKVASDFSVQIVSGEYPNAIMDVVPFPGNKEFYPRMEVYIRKKTGEEFVFNKKEGEKARYLFYGGEQMISKATGNKGEPVIGSAPGLPPQAYQLVLSSSAQKLIEDKIFFFPRKNKKTKDALIEDLKLSKLYSFFPVYYKSLPETKFVTSQEYFDFSLPQIDRIDDTKIFRSVLNMKTAIKSLVGANKEKWQTCINDLQVCLFEIREHYPDELKVDIRLQLLSYHGLKGQEFHTAFILK